MASAFFKRLAPLRWPLQQLQELLFPPRCVGCRTAGDHLCAACLDRIDRFAEPTCPRCDLPTTRPRSRCHACQRTTTSALTGLRVVGPHTEPLRAAIHALKYEGRRSLAVPLGELMATRWHDAGVPIDGIIPIPLHPERQRARGYNQSALLAEMVAQLSGIPLQPEVAWRARATSPQVGLDRAQRQENVQGAFGAAATAAGGRWLLTDDVCTTGATLEACAGALRAVGAREVWALTLARPHHSAETRSPLAPAV